ncbi:MAG: MFS transporter [Gemmataceae bacterium]
MSLPVRVLVVLVAAIGFLFDTYELLMFPVIGADAVSELLKVPVDSDPVRLWIGRMLWIAALSGGICGLLGGYFIDRFGRKTVMVASILMYSFSPVCAAFSSSLAMLVFFRCTTFIGVCVEMVAAVTWLAELFETKRSRELAIGWSLAAASLGGILVTAVYQYLVVYLKNPDAPILNLPLPMMARGDNLAWRYTLLTGLIPGLLILVLLPFVPESKVWKERKLAGTLKRPSFSELFAPDLIRTTLVTTVLSACGYAAAFGALQMTPSQMVPGLPAVSTDFKKGRADIAASQKAVNAALEKQKESIEAFEKAGIPVPTPEKPAPANDANAEKLKELIANRTAAEAALKQAEKTLGEARKAFLPTAQKVKEYRGNIQLWQELGGLLGRILLAVFLIFIPSRTLLQLFLVPGVVLLPLTYYYFYQQPYFVFAIAVFLCGLLTVAQFSFMSEFLPKVFPLHLRGTGGSFASNVGGRMLGTMAAIVNTELLAPRFSGDNPSNVAMAAAIIGGSVFLIAFAFSFFLPVPRTEEAKPSSD